MSSPDLTNLQPGLSAPSQSVAAVTPNDVTPLSPPARALYVGGAGDVSLIGVDDAAAVTFVGVAAGSILPVSCKIVRATSTTATNIVALR